jgi:hypothetical protein
MITTELRHTIAAGLHDGSIVPYLGPGVLADVISTTDGQPIPATSDQLIIGLNNGKPMAPKLMYEFPRAAMNVELKRGRNAVNRFLDAAYAPSTWTRAAAHDWLAGFMPHYVIDINRDAQLLDTYAGTAHILVLGCARIGGTDYRFKLYAYDGVTYTKITPEQANPALPVLFKPMGAPRPEPSYIASDADYVDFITELMGGFAIPLHVKKLREGKRYLLLGMSLNRDTERMVLADMIYAAAVPSGWVLIAEPTDKERRFCKKLGLEVVEADVMELIGATVAA